MNKQTTQQFRLLVKLMPISTFRCRISFQDGDNCVNTTSLVNATTEELGRYVVNGSIACRNYSDGSVDPVVEFWE